VILRLTLGVAILCFGAQAFAHRQHHVWTEIERNPNTGLIEISHRFHIQDGLHILQDKGPDAAALPIESVEALAHLALYVDQHFAIWPRCDSTKIRSLELIGAGIDELSFSNTLLQDIEPYAASFININSAAGQYTYQFTSDSAKEQPEVVHCVQSLQNSSSFSIF
jgi:hypothetical protein